MPQLDSKPIARRISANRLFSTPTLVLGVFSLIVLAAADALPALPFPDAAVGPAPAQTSAAPSSSPEALALVEKMAERIASYPKLESWQARAHATTSRMTSEWTPKSTTTSEKIVTVDGPYWSEEILSAVETEDGRTRDVTKKMRQEAADRAAKQRRSSPEERKADQSSRGRRSLDMASDEIFPFGPERRAGYDFALEGQAELDGVPIVLLRSRSRVRSQEKLEGLYFVDPETFDVRRAELTLAKRPAPLKRMEIEFDFLVLPEGYHMFAKAVMRIHVGIIIKNIRVEAVETYRDFKIGDTIPNPLFPGLF
jgi:hypothetical protein